MGPTPATRRKWDTSLKGAPDVTTRGGARRGTMRDSQSPNRGVRRGREGLSSVSGAESRSPTGPIAEVLHLAAERPASARAQAPSGTRFAGRSSFQGGRHRLLDSAVGV